MPLCPCRTQEPFPSKNYLLLNLHFTNGFLLSSLYNFPLEMQGANRKFSKRYLTYLDQGGK